MDFYNNNNQFRLIVFKNIKKNNNYKNYNKFMKKMNNE